MEARIGVASLCCFAAFVAGAWGCGSSPAEPSAGPVATSPATTTPMAAPSASETTAPAASSAMASAEPAMPPEPPPPPSFRGRCPEKMVEFTGGKFKSSYYKAELELEPFCLDENLATAAEYKACVDAGKCDKSAVHACDPSTYGVEGRENLPMVCVDFPQAEAYCKAQGKRIVDDLEWEWAARAGEEARVYPWGADAPDTQLCWSGKEKRTTPCPVGTYAQGPKGVFDLVGNSNQWTASKNDKIGTFRIGRGGSWKDGVESQVKITWAGGFKHTYRCGFLGIRCATAVPK